MAGLSSVMMAVADAHALELLHVRSMIVHHIENEYKNFSATVMISVRTAHVRCYKDMCACR